MNTNYINQLKEILKASGQSQASLALELGVTFAALNRWINGVAKPRPKMLKAIAKMHRHRVGYIALSETLDRLLKASATFKIKNLAQRIQDNDDLRDELILEHTYNSTTIEGSIIDKREAESILFHNQIVNEKNMVEHLEISNHGALLRDILCGKYGSVINESLIKQFHNILMTGIRHDAGEYSKLQRAIRGLDIALKHPEDIPEEMKRLFRTWRSNNLKCSPIESIAEFHSSFELIHPFGDGNGRVGRLLMIMQCLSHDLPPIIIESKRKTEYYEVLEYSQKKTNEPLIAFLVDEMGKTHKLIKRYI